MRNVIVLLSVTLVASTTWSCSGSTSNSDDQAPAGQAGAGGGSGGPAGGSGGSSGDAGSGGSTGSTAGQGGTAGNDPADAGQPDAPEPEAGTAGTGGSGTGSGDVGIYGVCHTPGDCAVGLTCTTVVQDPEYGQCTHDCVDDADCEPSPSGNPVACQPEAGICISLCGVHGGNCPAGLVCTAHEYCLEPSGVEATKGPGEHCSGKAECLGDAECVEGENTSAYCAPLCTTNEDCTAAAPGHVGQCIEAGGMFNFCMFFCGMMANGAPCPGDLVCEANTICR
ncbi:MAG: hypothetical protein ACOC1F_10750 [Myxococcota bacterium]